MDIVREVVSSALFGDIVLLSACVLVIVWVLKRAILRHKAQKSDD